MGRIGYKNTCQDRKICKRERERERERDEIEVGRNINNMCHVREKIDG